MKSNTLRALDLDCPKKHDVWQEIEKMLRDDAQDHAETYVKSAKVDLGGE